jgi:TonB family protein
MSNSPLRKDDLRLTASHNREYREVSPAESARSQATPHRADLQAILDGAMDKMEAMGAAIALNGEEGVFCEASTGDLAPEVGTPLYAGVGLAGRCLSTGEIQLCNQANADSRLDPGVSKALGIGSVLMLPIKQNSRVVGVLGVLSHKPNAFNETHVAVGSRLAERVSSACARLELHRNRLAGPRNTTQGLAYAMDLERLLEAAYVLQGKDRLRNMDTAETLEPSRQSGPPSESVAGANGLWSRVRPPDRPWNSLVDQPRLSPLAATITKLWNRVPALGTSQMPSDRLLVLAGLSPLVIFLLLFVFLGRPAFMRHSQPASLQTAAIAAPTTPLDKPVAAHLPGLLTSGHTASAGLNNPRGSSLAIDHGNTQYIDAAQDQPAGKNADALANDSDTAHAIQEIGVDGAPETAPPIAALPISAPDSLIGILSAPVSLPVAGMDISEGIAGGKLERQVSPVYPSQALSLRLEGWVVLHGVVVENGTIQDLSVVSGHPLLARAALDAVTRWRYQPYRLNGKPTRMPMEIKLEFKLR